MIDILHPAHVHFFRNLYRELTERGHEVLILSRQKDCATSLLTELDVPHCCLGRSRRSLSGQVVECLHRTAGIVREARRFRPDVLTGIMGPTIALAGRLLRRPSVVFYDTEFARLTNSFVYPLATYVIHPQCYRAPPRSNEIRYAGLHELAYLHPHRFQASRARVVEAGIDPETRYAVVRFVGWWASHDRGERGLASSQKLEVIRRLERFVKVVVSSESDVPEEIADRVYTGPRSSLHDVLAHASLYYGESATMASEAAVLGTPGIYIATTGRGYLDELSRHGLLNQFTDDQFEASMDVAEELLQSPATSRDESLQKRDAMLDEMVDVTDFMVKLFESRFAR